MSHNKKLRLNKTLRINARFIGRLLLSAPRKAAEIFDRKKAPTIRPAVEQSRRFESGDYYEQYVPHELQRS
jgi:hypothetical protein